MSTYEPEPSSKLGISQTFCMKDLASYYKFIGDEKTIPLLF